MISKREAKAVCSTCGRPIYDNVDASKIVICVLCVQKRLAAFNQKNSPEEQERAIKAITEMGIKKTARLVGVTPKAVRNWVKKKGIPKTQLEFALKIGNA